MVEVFRRPDWGEVLNILLNATKILQNIIQNVKQGQCFKSSPKKLTKTLILPCRVTRLNLSFLDQNSLLENFLTQFPYLFCPILLS